MSGREFLVLSFVRAADGLSQQELSARLGLDPTIVVGLVDGLEDRGLMSRTKDPADRRRNVLSVDRRRDRRPRRRRAPPPRRAEAAFLAPLDRRPSGRSCAPSLRAVMAAPPALARPPDRAGVRHPGSAVNVRVCGRNSAAYANS